MFCMNREAPSGGNLRYLRRVLEFSDNLVGYGSVI